MSVNRQKPERKNRFSLSNIVTAMLIMAMVAMIVSPDAKALMLRMLMKTGLFQPDIPQEPIAKRLLAGASNADMKLLDRDGRPIGMDSMKGKVIFLNFWATWCAPCKAEMPSINSLYQEFRNDTSVVFLIVDVDGAISRSGAFLEKHGYELPLAVPGGPIPERFFNGTLPTTVVLDKTGAIAMKHEGIADYNSPRFIRFIEELSRNRAFPLAQACRPATRRSVPVPESLH